ncbi:hypothetical protein INT45_001304, partial [Circinella minor]
MASSSTDIPPPIAEEQEPPISGPSVNKPVPIPIRVEPKVFFANERTFLSWLNFTIVLVGFAIGLFNFGVDRVSRISAVLFLSTALLVMLYSLYKFHLRAYKIRKREISSNTNTTFYDDRMGPTFLCIFLALAMITNYY